MSKQSRGGGWRGRGRGGGGGRHANVASGSRQEPIDVQIARPAAAANEQTKALFGGFQKELDERYDRYERIVKFSRDITIESKRIIFLLHRVAQKHKDQAECVAILDEAQKRLSDLRLHSWKPIADELAADDLYLYQRAYTGGLQENIEAYSLYTYLRDRRLVTWTEIRVLLTFPEPDKCPSVECSLSDYLLGIGDLGGELMRLALNHISMGETGT